MHNKIQYFSVKTIFSSSWKDAPYTYVLITKEDYTEQAGLIENIRLSLNKYEKNELGRRKIEGEGGGAESVTRMFVSNFLIFLVRTKKICKKINLKTILREAEKKNSSLNGH